jgi:glucose uptake protein GlcU
MLFYCSASSQIERELWGIFPQKKQCLPVDPYEAIRGSSLGALTSVVVTSMATVNAAREVVFIIRLMSKG